MLAKEIKGFLHLNGIRLNTDLGQHFLIDDGVLSKILQSAKLREGDRVLEIGPGIGILTHELLKHGALVTAVEIDPRMIPLLRTYVTKNGSTATTNLNVIQGNALHADLPIKSPFKVIANIPYHITSPLLHRLLIEVSPRPQSLTLLIQKEVAENICSVGSESILTVLTQIFGTAEYVCDVPPSCFLPPPAVDSAVIHIDCYPEPLADATTTEKILSLVKHAMSKRRKMLSNSIGSLPFGMEAMESASIDPKRRPQTLRIDEWIALQKAIALHR